MANNDNDELNTSLDRLNSLLMNQLVPYFSDTTLNSVINESFETSSSPYKRVISEEGKKKLKTFKFKESQKLNDTCPIFQEKFEEDDLVTELPCGHCFIPGAISRWLEKENALCPVCRFELDSVEKRTPPPVRRRPRRMRPIIEEEPQHNSELDRLITPSIPRVRYLASERRLLPPYIVPPQVQQALPPPPIPPPIPPPAILPPLAIEPIRQPLPTVQVENHRRQRTLPPLPRITPRLPSMYNYRRPNNEMFRMYGIGTNRNRNNQTREVEQALRRVRR